MTPSPHFTPDLFEFLADLWRKTTGGSGSKPTKTGTRPTSRTRFWRSCPTLAKGSPASARTWSPIHGLPAGPCLGFTGMCVSRRTRAPIRQTRAFTSATRWDGRSTDPASTCTSSPAWSSPRPESGDPTRQRSGRYAGRSLITRTGGRHSSTKGDSSRSTGSMPNHSSGPQGGVDPEHPLIEYLKLKSFAAGTTFSQDDACAPNFIDIYEDKCRTAAPLMEFLCDAVGLNW